MSSKTLPSPEHAVTYTYDNFNDPKTFTGATTLSYGFDVLGRLTSETQAYGSVAYQHDLANRRNRLTWQDGTYLTYEYDTVDEITDIKESGSTVLASFTYDDLGERKTRTLANGTSTTYGYDPVSRLTSLALAGSANTNTATLSNYSPAGEIGAHANSNDAFAWEAGTTGSKANGVNGLNQFTTVAGMTQSYDVWGNLTGTGSYSYTSENMLKAAGSDTLAYDPIGRLHEYDVPTATRFVYDGGIISEELNSSGIVLRRYAFGPNGDEPIVWYEGSGTATKRYIDQDERGSVTRITDSTGASVAVNSYDEYGIPISANQSRFGYAGQAWLAEIGLAYYKARAYSPALGRFLQTDPIGYANGPNWYNYVHSDPINLIDPLGLGEIVVTGVNCTKHPENSKCHNGSSTSTTNNSAGNGPAAGPGGGTPPDEIVVTGRRPPSIFNRIYRWFVPDPCSGQGTDEGAGTPAGYDPYNVDEKGSLAQLYSHVLPEHGYGTASGKSEFNLEFLNPGVLIPAILTIIQTQPACAAGGRAAYTINLGQAVGYDAVHGGSTDYITVIMGPDVDRNRTLSTAYPGCR